MTPTLLLLFAGGGAGAWVGRRLRLPMWPLTGAVLGAVLLGLLLPGAVSVPSGWRLVAQVLVGAAVGAGIEPEVLEEFRAVLVPGLLAVVSIVAVGVGTGLLIAASGHVDHVSAVLGMIPGGVGEMVASATALDADVPVVAGMHVVRLVVSLAALPLVTRLVVAIAGRSGGGAEPDRPGRG